MVDFIISKIGYIQSIQKNYIDCIYHDSKPTNLAEPIKQYNKIDTVYISTKSNKKLIQAHFNSDLLNLFQKRFHNAALHSFMGSNKLKISAWKFRIKFNKVGDSNLTKSFN